MQLPSRTQSPVDRAASLVRLMEENAQGDYIGESISQLEHSLQCAHLGVKAGEPSPIPDKSSLPALICFPVEATILDSNPRRKF